MKVYAAYSKNGKERLISSSGGIFSLLAKVALSDNGIVYGVAMSEDCKRAEFIRVVDEECLYKLRTSKYLQAYIGDTFKHVKDDLENGLVVLFSGTCCQINGLIGFLGAGKEVGAVKEKFPNLYCVDVICHGSPSPALWREYVEYIEKENKARLVGINFRCKDSSWINLGMKKIYRDEKTIRWKQKKLYISKDKDPYMLMFLRDYSLRPSCYKCKAKETKQSDITLADFWGIEKYHPDMTDGKGTSLVLIRTQRGGGFFQRVVPELKLKEVSYVEGVESNKAEFQSAPRPVQRDLFFTDMKVLSFEELKIKYGMPTQIPLKRKIKSILKKEINKCQKYLGDGKQITLPMDYCLCFELLVAKKADKRKV